VIVGEFKSQFKYEFKNCVRRTNIALKANQLQVTTIHAQAMQPLSEYTTLSMIFPDENLEEKEDNPFDCSFSQLHGLSEAQNCNHHLATPCLISIFIELLIFMLRSQFNGITSWCVCFSHYLY
jgi:hypothetical protein